MAQLGAVGFRVPQQHAAKRWLAGVRRFRVFWLGRSGEARRRYAAASRQNVARRPARALSSVGGASLRGRHVLRTTAARLSAAFRLALGANPTQRVHTGALAGTCACRWRRKLE